MDKEQIEAASAAFRAWWQKEFNEPEYCHKPDDRAELAWLASATASEARIAEQVEESYRKGWGEGMQEAAALIASDDSCNVLAKLESDLAALLDVPYYMDPPDGGSVTLIEQVRRMAEDAKRYRWLRDSGPEGKPAVMIEGRWYGAKHGNGVGFDLDSAIDAALAGSATPSTPQLVQAFAIATAGPQTADEATLKARAEGRAEAVQILTQLSAEDGLDDCIGCQQAGFDGEWDAYWKDDKLRALFRVDDVAWSVVQDMESRMYDALRKESEAAMDKAFDTAPAPADTLKNADSERKDVCAEMRALCSACGGTGDVHGLDGEWRGECDCQASQWKRDEVDAARYRWLLDNYAFGDGYNVIDDALNNGEADKYLSPAIDAARTATIESTSATLKEGGNG